MNKGFCGVSFHDITDSLLNQDPYMVLADFESYAQAQNRAVELFKDCLLYTSTARSHSSFSNTSRRNRFSSETGILRPSSRSQELKIFREAV